MKLIYKSEKENESCRRKHWRISYGFRRDYNREMRKAYGTEGEDEKGISTSFSGKELMSVARPAFSHVASFENGHESRDASGFFQCDGTQGIPGRRLGGASEIPDLQIKTELVF